MYVHGNQFTGTTDHRPQTDGHTLNLSYYLTALPSKLGLVRTGLDWTGGAEEAGAGILFRQGTMTSPGLIVDWCSRRADLEGVEVCVFVGNFTAKSLCNLLLMSCTKLLDDGIRQDTFGGKDGSKPNNKKISNRNWLARFRNSLSFVIINSKSNRFKPSYWKVHPCSPWGLCIWVWGWGLAWNGTHWTSQCSCPWSDCQSSWSWWSWAWGWSQSKDGGRYASSFSLLHSLPLQQKFTQTSLGRLAGKTSVILILGLWSQNIPMSVFWRFGVSFATVWNCFFWRWVWEGLASPSGVVGLRVSPAIGKLYHYRIHVNSCPVQCTCCHERMHH